MSDTIIITQQQVHTLQATMMPTTVVVSAQSSVVSDDDNHIMIPASPVIHTMMAANNQIMLLDATRVNILTAGTQGPQGQGIPIGGLAGQFLRKNTGVDFDTAWVNGTTAFIDAHTYSMGGGV